MDEEKKEPHRSAAATGAIGIVVLILLYVLSTGPVVRFVLMRGPNHAAEELITMFYLPLQCICEHSEVCSKAMNAYVKFCIREFP